jgi:HPt (histidine-containing phosphotransfer) domain-containing protein
MSMRSAVSPAFAMPGGESGGPAGTRPVDLAHLARQTMGDRELEREVLQLFVQQALAVRARIADATANERLLLVHSLKGSARGVGAFAIADCAAELEESPGDKLAIDRLERRIAEVCDFVAAISR